MDTTAEEILMALSTTTTVPSSNSSSSQSIISSSTRTIPRADAEEDIQDLVEKLIPRVGMEMDPTIWDNISNSWALNVPRQLEFGMMNRKYPGTNLYFTADEFIVMKNAMREYSRRDNLTYYTFSNGHRMLNRRIPIEIRESIPLSKLIDRNGIKVRYFRNFVLEDHTMNIFGNGFMTIAEVDTYQGSLRRCRGFQTELSEK